MPWRFLVDEDTDTAVSDELRSRGFDAVTVASALGKGKPDQVVADHARRENRVLITSDRDFLDVGLYGQIRIFLVANDGSTGTEIADRSAELVRLAERPSDLKRVTWI